MARYSGGGNHWQVMLVKQGLTFISFLHACSDKYFCSKGGKVRPVLYISYLNLGQRVLHERRNSSHGVIVFQCSAVVAQRPNTYQLIVMCSLSKLIRQISTNQHCCTCFT